MYDIVTMKLLRAILNAPWMIDNSTRRAYMPKVIRLMQGEDVSFQEESKDDLAPYAYNLHYNHAYSNFANAPSGSVAVFRVIGPITKYDGWCNYGTETMMRRMREADRQANITGHLLEIDSGGGEGTNIETVARFIRNEITKPVVAWYNGTMASAAYYMGVAADEIYASEETDVVGSVGVYVSFMDLRKHYEEKGIVVHEIYAEQSELKNYDFEKAREGEYEIIQKNFLNPYAQRFIDTVREMRPDLQEEDAYKGQVYMAEDAERIGMIDGRLSFEEAVQRVMTLASGSAGPQTNFTNMKRINAVLGYEVQLKDGGAWLREDELAQLESNLVADGHKAVATDSLADIHSKLDAISQKQTEMQTEMDNLKTATADFGQSLEDQRAELDRIGGAPGAGPINVQSNGDEYEEDTAGRQQPVSELDELEAAARADAPVL